ncbi:hypothetical protein [Alicyclobacillus sp. SO9]|uniref:hypothetical protein n=1 Tax=Alicyclobacillus sp. SO9 TaxID=2665646 RepID=UPI0018E8FD7E|nr:hypothetical protein [Alicyclobacillus sp. SO9]QQE78480.1 hypothetical protein GI364_21840 [Alicyclobacillus sp. SO9]QQE79584.1 hypothetical protein GI364_03560 [Alicyclobacillus sp. SO9]QQE81559.1 hypothetical protein GI364_24990 [Alicyclobacillus sp. SO9]
MIWVALFFSSILVVHGFRQKVTWREWIVNVPAFIFALLGSGIVSFNIWPKINLLWGIQWLFEPITKWLYSIL